jgi:allantoin racemase
MSDLESWFVDPRDAEPFTRRKFLGAAGAAAAFAAVPSAVAAVNAGSPASGGVTDGEKGLEVGVKKIMILGITAPAAGRSDTSGRPDAELTALLGPGWQVERHSVSRGTGHVEYRYYNALALPEMLKLVKRADREGFHGAFINCFYDTGLEDAREVAEKVSITGPCESTVLTAAALGHRFSILVGRRKWIPKMSDTVSRYGLSGRLASWKPLELGVPEFNEDRERTMDLMRKAAYEAVHEDGAEVVILGCTAGRGFYAELQEELGVPVLDPILTPLMFIQYLAEINHRFGWMHSKIGGYATPGREEMERFRLAEQFPGWSEAWRW